MELSEWVESRALNIKKCGFVKAILLSLTHGKFRIPKPTLPGNIQGLRSNGLNGKATLSTDLIIKI
jgi:hypothetical protein